MTHIQLQNSPNRERGIRKLWQWFFSPANYPTLPGRIKKSSLITLSILFFPTPWFKNSLLFLPFFPPLLPCKESLMRHICLFPWYFKERLPAESKEIYRIKQETNVCSSVTDTNLTFRINCREIFFCTWSKWNHVSHFLLWCKVWCFTEKNDWLLSISLYFVQDLHMYGSKEPLRTSFAIEIFHN